LRKTNWNGSLRRTRSMRRRVSIASLTRRSQKVLLSIPQTIRTGDPRSFLRAAPGRSEEHTSELQSRRDLVCRLLLEKKKKNYRYNEQPCRDLNSSSKYSSLFFTSARKRFPYYLHDTADPKRSRLVIGHLPRVAQRHD